MQIQNIYIGCLFVDKFTYITYSTCVSYDIYTFKFQINKFVVIEKQSN